MAQPKWVLGTVVPKKLRPAKPQFRISAALRKFIVGKLHEHLNGSESVGAVLTHDGMLFYGVHQKHAHPNLNGTAIEVAAGIACTSGRHQFIAAAVHQPVGPYYFNGVELERLAEHFCAGSRDMILIRSDADGIDSFKHSTRLPEPAGGRRKATIDPQPQVAYEKYDLSLNAADVIDGKLPRQFLRYVDQRLRECYLRNSTADGITKPGRKRHASCVFTPDGHLFFGVNMRAAAESCDRCSEWTAIGASFVGGCERQLVGAIVYSPDYPNGRVECCGKCRNALGGCIHPEFGDMLIRYVELGRPARITRFSRMPNTTYEQAETQRIGRRKARR